MAMTAYHVDCKILCFVYELAYLDKLNRLPKENYYLKVYNYRVKDDGQISFEEHTSMDLV